MIASYVAGIPECEDVLSVKRGTRSSVPCHCCMIQKEDLSQTNVSQTGV